MSIIKLKYDLKSYYYYYQHCQIIEIAREFQKNIYFSFMDCVKAFDWVDHKKLENSSRDANTRPPCCLLRNLYAGQEATVRTRHGTMDLFKIGKGVCQAIYCHPAYLTSTQSISCETQGQMNHKLKSSLPGEISITSDMQMTPPLGQKVKRN